MAVEPELVEFLAAMEGLKEKLGPLLIQMPPSFEATNLSDLQRFTSNLPD